MAMVINSNIMSLNAQRNLTMSQGEQNQAMERLSSGKRINSAADDAAGLAISNRMTSEVRGLNQAVRNANDGISMIQTAEGALDETTNILQRMRELSVQSASGTYNDSNRATMNAEVQQLKAEIDRIAESTSFNGQNLLDGTIEGVGLQVGVSAGQTIEVNIGQLDTDSLGTSDEGGVSSVGTDNALATGDLVINGVAVGASQASDDTASTDNAGASAIAKAAAINKVSDESGVTAIVDTNTVAGSTMTAGAAVSGETIDLNGVSISVDVTTDTATTRASLVEAINASSAQTGVTAIDTGDDNQGITLEAEDGRNIELALNGALTAANTGLADSGTYEGGFTLVSNDRSDIEITGGDGTTGADLANAGLSAGTYTAGAASVTSTERSSEVTLGDPATAAEVTGVADVSTTGVAFSDGAVQASTTAAAAVVATDFSGAITSGGFTTGTTGTYNFAATTAAASTASAAYGNTDATFDFSTNSATFDITVDGVTTTLSINQDVQNIGDGQDAINQALINAGIDGTVSVTNDGSNFTFTTNSQGATSTVSVGNFQDGTGVGGAAALTSNLGLTSGDSASGTSAAETFQISVDGGSNVTLTIDANITNTTDLENELNNALLEAGLDTAVNVTNNGTDLTIQSANTGENSDIDFSGMSANLQTAFGLTAATDGTAGVDNTETFEVTHSTLGTSVITLDTSITDLTTALADINDDLAAGLTAQDDGSGNIQIVEDAASDGGTITVGNFSDPAAASALGFVGASTDVTGSTGSNGSITLTVDGTTEALTIDLDTDGTVAGAQAALQNAIDDSATLVGDVTVGIDGNKLVLTSASTGAASNITVDALDANVASALGLSALQTDTGSDPVNAAADGLDTGDMVINGVAISGADAANDTASFDGASTSDKTASGIAIAAAINESSKDTGVSATVNATELTGGTTTTAGNAGATGSVFINGVEVELSIQSSAENNRTHAIDQINAVSGQTGVVASDNGSSLTLTAADGRNISVAIDTDAASVGNNGGIVGTDFGLDANEVGIGQDDLTATPASLSNTYETTYSTVALESAGTIELEGGTNGTAGLEGLGFKTGTFGGGADGQLLKDVDISTVEGANAALTAIDNALETINDVRADLGAVNNRLDFTINNLSNVSENTAAARSRIQDADFAAESAALSRAQVLQQAGTAMLAQANAAPQQVLSLLQ